MAFRTFALFSLFSWAAAVTNPLVSRDLWSSIEDLRFTADSITRDSAVFWQYPLATSANTVLNDVTTFNSEVQTALTQIPATVMSEEDADNTRRVFLDIYYDTQDGFVALSYAASFLEPFGLVPMFCCLTQCIQTGMHTLVNETLAVTPEDYVSPIQTLAGPILSWADSVVNFYC
ncbi:hypothetical protein EV421DRAFT_1770794 [Armillaria borealis]|uniref:Uncharacterized protein n=1 Tax=Armillaria borealis TaxID=47425 RepID=A0AA39JZ77_9AGAR|nr:hypothetical protein EV421DRAFT_1770794 [Armillaria borealis]